MHAATLLFIGLFGPHAQTVSQAPALFRHIDLGFTRVELGSTFANPVLSRVVDDSTGELRDLAYSGAESIQLRYDREQIVRAILFTYPASYNWQREVRDYAKSLGQPQELRNDARRPEAVWRDSATVFRIWCVPARRGSECRGELRDRAPARPAR